MRAFVLRMLINFHVTTNYLSNHSYPAVRKFYVLDLPVFEVTGPSTAQPRDPSSKQNVRILESVTN